MSKTLSSKKKYVIIVAIILIIILAAGGIALSKMPLGNTYIMDGKRYLNVTERDMGSGVWICTETSYGYVFYEDEDGKMRYCKINTAQGEPVEWLESGAFGYRSEGDKRPLMMSSDTGSHSRGLYCTEIKDGVYRMRCFENSEWTEFDMKRLYDSDRLNDENEMNTLAGQAVVSALTEDNPDFIYEVANVELNEENLIADMPMVKGKCLILVGGPKVTEALGPEVEVGFQLGYGENGLKPWLVYIDNHSRNHTIYQQGQLQFEIGGGFDYLFNKEREDAEASYSEENPRVFYSFER